jgi:hypothetical protein
MSATPAAQASDNSDWIRDLVCLAFPEGEARERVLFDLVKQFAKMDPEDPEWLRYKLSVVECRAMENVARGLNDAAAEQARLRGVTREIADYTTTQLKGTIESASLNMRQLLEDVQHSLHDAIAGDAILRMYTEATKQQFASVIKSIVEDTLARALTLAHERMDEWVKKDLEKFVREAQRLLATATSEFQVKLGGAWGKLLWACFGGGLIVGSFLLAGGFWLGRRW